ncbi:hypothetical protein [Streptomyces griseoluteus]
MCRTSRDGEWRLQTNATAKVLDNYYPLSPAYVPVRVRHTYELDLPYCD